jgi:hypothetical protein
VAAARAEGGGVTSTRSPLEAFLEELARGAPAADGGGARLPELMFAASAAAVVTFCALLAPEQAGTAAQAEAAGWRADRASREQAVADAAILLAAVGTRIEIGRGAAGGGHLRHPPVDALATPCGSRAQRGRAAGERDVDPSTAPPGEAGGGGIVALISRLQDSDAHMAADVGAGWAARSAALDGLWGYARSHGSAAGLAALAYGAEGRLSLGGRERVGPQPDAVAPSPSRVHSRTHLYGARGLGRGAGAAAGARTPSRSAQPSLRTPRSPRTYAFAPSAGVSPRAARFRNAAQLERACSGRGAALSPREAHDPSRSPLTPRAPPDVHEPPAGRTALAAARAAPAIKAAEAARLTACNLLVRSGVGVTDALPLPQSFGSELAACARMHVSAKARYVYRETRSKPQGSTGQHPSALVKPSETPN